MTKKSKQQDIRCPRVAESFESFFTNIFICIYIYVPAGELESAWKFLSSSLYKRYIGGLEISRLVKRCQFLNVS